jgi:hypothetical protein
MAEPHTGWLQRAGEGTAEEDNESMVALLADEAEYWKERAEALDDIVDELKAEIDAAQRRAEITEAWRKGLAEELLDGTGFTDAEPPFRAAALILLASLVLWGLLGLVAFATYSYFTG